MNFKIILKSRWIFTGLFIAFFSATLSAQTKSEVITNQSVISLVKAGLDKSIVIATINSAESKFDLSTAGIISLKKQGVHGDVISAMLTKTSGVKASGSSSNAPPAEKPSAFGNLDPGIYFADPNGKYTQLEPSVFTQSKIGSGILTGLTYGIAKTKAKAVLSGPVANLKFAGGTSVFYFIFPKNAGGNIGNEGNQNLWYSNATSPNEFMMVKFKSVNTSKQKIREVVTGSFGTYSGFSSGIPEESKESFRFEKISSGVYKIYFDNQLAAGEYAFIYAGGTAAGMGTTPAQRAFDFSITN
ncbi:MAG: hypothetical protein EOO86_04490 [Pedobacter sp.]|nr:MAG: hypothetical protein EOO86_04490 [Pedobacter sp.]